MRGGTKREAHPDRPYPGHRARYVKDHSSRLDSSHKSLTLFTRGNPTTARYPSKTKKKTLTDVVSPHLVRRHRRLERVVRRARGNVLALPPLFVLFVIIPIVLAACGVVKLRFGKARSCVWKREVEREREWEWAPAGRLGLFPMSFYYRRDVVFVRRDEGPEKVSRNPDGRSADGGWRWGISGTQQDSRYIAGRHAARRRLVFLLLAAHSPETERATCAPKSNRNPRGEPHVVVPTRRPRAKLQRLRSGRSLRLLMSATLVHFSGRTGSRTLTSTHLIRHELARTGRIFPRWNCKARKRESETEGRQAASRPACIRILTHHRGCTDA
ncbi:hypothetical protein C8Q74DRAFT_294149 [Fomes fomentarius]|nr:hypothetical protein C8Q74DRAFT_294149 [Fomes fomentarius]